MIYFDIISIYLRNVENYIEVTNQLYYEKDYLYYFSTDHYFKIRMPYLSESDGIYSIYLDKILVNDLFDGMNYFKKNSIFLKDDIFNKLEYKFLSKDEFIVWMIKNNFYLYSFYVEFIYEIMKRFKYEFYYNKDIIYVKIEDFEIKFINCLEKFDYIK